MSANIFGNRLKIVSFGESHGPAYGVVIDGFPANVGIDEKLLRKNLDRRKPGTSNFVSGRKEKDDFEILSGVYKKKSLGTPICVIVKNHNQISTDYDKIKDTARIGHADDTWKLKFQHVDHRGGGRSSGRETINRVIAGSFAEMLLRKVMKNTQVICFPSQIGPHQLNANDYKSGQLPARIQKFLEQAKTNGESYGGVAECRILNPNPGLGQPVFHKIKSDLAASMLSLGATVGFEFGEGFNSSNLSGTVFHKEFNSKNYGGIRGGITTGEDILFRVAFKPTSSIKDIAKKGRHDPCIVPRAIPVIESMAWIILADHYLWTLTDLA